MNPYTALKKPSPFHFTSLFIYFFSLTLSTLHFNLLFYSYIQLTSLHFPSSFTLFRLHFSSLVLTFLTLMYLGLHVKLIFLSILNKILSTRQTSLKIRPLNFKKFCPAGSQLSHAGRGGDGRTGRSTEVMKAIVAFSNYVK